ncbi:MAG: hypothetical protein MHM6MM_003037 [Cercozoa sp. M6MM]
MPVSCHVVGEVLRSDDEFGHRAAEKMREVFKKLKIPASDDTVTAVRDFLVETLLTGSRDAVINDLKEFLAEYSSEYVEWLLNECPDSPPALERPPPPPGARRPRRVERQFYRPPQRSKTSFEERPRKSAEERPRRRSRSPPLRSAVRAVVRQNASGLDFKLREKTRESTRAPPASTPSKKKTHLPPPSARVLKETRPVPKPKKTPEESKPEPQKQEKTSVGEQMFTKTEVMSMVREMLQQDMYRFLSTVSSPWIYPLPHAPYYSRLQ